MINGSGWDTFKVALAVVFLLSFAAIGVTCVFNPDWGIKHFGRSLISGGELRKEWNRMQMSTLGLISAVFALYMLYVLLLK